MNRTALRRLVLLVTLMAFLVPALVGPFGSLCLCLGDGPAAVTVGCCCSDETPAVPADDPARDAGPAWTVPDACPCVDVTGSDQAAVPERRAEAVPEPVLDALPLATVEPFAAAGVAPCAFRVRPPPEPRSSPPRHRVLRC